MLETGELLNEDNVSGDWLQYGELYSWFVMTQNCSLTTCRNSRKKLKKLHALHLAVDWLGPEEVGRVLSAT